MASCVYLIWQLQPIAESKREAFLGNERADLDNHLVRREDDKDKWNSHNLHNKKKSLDDVIYELK